MQTGMTAKGPQGMAGRRKRHTPEFKARIALEAMEGSSSGRVLARRYQLHPAQIAQWKRRLRDHAATVFRRNAGPDSKVRRTELARARAQISRLNAEIAWLGGRLRQTGVRLRDLVEPDHPELSISRQCTLLGLPRRTYYYHPKPASRDQLALVEAIERQHSAAPRHGSRTITASLRRQGWKVNRKRVQRVMRLMDGRRTHATRRPLDRSQPVHRAQQQILPGRRKTVWPCGGWRAVATP